MATIVMVMTAVSSFASTSASLGIQDPVRCGSKVFRIVFYNAENLFDTINQPGRNDDAFTPLGDRRWNSYRLNNKLKNLYRALAASGGWELPSIIGLCEVENRTVLEMLVNKTGFRNSGYSIIHRNSADSRGIDVAVLYRDEDFILLDTLFMEIRFPFDTTQTTRDILYLKGIAAGQTDTLHIFVNHWPSRWGGQAVTEPYRIFAASHLRSFTDSLLNSGDRASIIIMGDFNDEPDDVSLTQYLGAGFQYEEADPHKLYNLFCKKKHQGRGTLKYQGQWLLFDQFIVSGSLLDNSRAIYTCPDSSRIFSPGFLLVPDNVWFGYKPYRTYEGFRHTGGFSDHLPIVLDLFW